MMNVREDRNQVSSTERERRQAMITPDTKDWTWVLDRRCEECGIDVRTFEREDFGEIIRANATTWKQLLSDPLATTRPSSDRWSAVEYGCHVRDVYLLARQRLTLMLERDDPTFENWDQDATAEASNYAEQDPERVAAELIEAAEGAADGFGNVTEHEWERPGTRSDGARFTVQSFARYIIHDPLHHQHDVEEGLSRLRSRTASP